MVPGALSTVTPCRSARPERGRTWASKPGGKASRMPVGISARRHGRQHHGLRHGRQQVEPGGTGGGVGRQGQIAAHAAGARSGPGSSVMCRPSARGARRSGPPAGAPAPACRAPARPPPGQSPVSSRTWLRVAAEHAGTRARRRWPGSSRSPCAPAWRGALASRSPVSAAKPITSPGRGALRGTGCAGCPGSRPARSRAAARPRAS